MSPRTKTIIIIVAVAVGLIIWDLVVLFNEAEDDTISNILFEGSQHAAALPYGFGMLATHFFWPTRRHLLPIKLMIASLVAGALLLTVGGWVCGMPDWWGLLSLVTGGAAGKLWPNSLEEDHA